MCSNLNARTWTARTALVVAAAFASAMACGGETKTPRPTSGSPQVVLRIDEGVGFAPPAVGLRNLPEVSLFSEGSLITEERTEGEPPPVVPKLMLRRLSAAGVRKVRDAAEHAGLAGPDRLYEDSRIADAPTTTFVYHDEDGLHQVSAYALGLEGGPGSPTEDQQARKKLADFRDKMRDPSWLGSDSSEPAGWTLRAPLATFGETAPAESFYKRCGVVAGDDLTQVTEAASEASDVTAWVSEGAEYDLVFRPLLPDESGCQNP